MIVELSYYNCFLKQAVDSQGPAEEAREARNEPNQMQHIDSVGEKVLATNSTATFNILDQSKHSYKLSTCYYMCISY